jgi:crotonobetainyl-CoA:carnitine CoA-transferase CaiB-like acyl-CoA transferase
MAVTGHPGGEPARAGVAISDLATGLWAATAMLAAYVKVLRTGVGSVVEVPLVDSTMTLLSYIGTTAAFTGSEPGPVGSRHHTLVPYGAFPTADGWIAVAVIGDKFWRNLVSALELTDTKNMETNAEREAQRELVTEMVAEATARLTTADAMARLEAADVPHAPIRSVLDTLSNPYGQGAVQSIETESGTYSVVNAPTGLRPDLRPAPTLGQHTQEILADLT